MAADLPDPPTPLAEISHGPGAFEQFLENNQKSLLALTILLALGAAAFVVYRGIGKSQEETAGALLSKASDTASLQAVINDHANTRAARSAAVLLANQQWIEGQQDAAIATLRGFIDANPQHPAIATARASLASKLMFQGKNAEAAELFEQVADDATGRYLAPYAMISLGDLERAAGDLDKAANLYQRAKTDFPDSGFAQTASQRLASLNAKAPTEVEPPPAPEAPQETTAPAVQNPPGPPAVPAPDHNQESTPENTSAPGNENAPEDTSPANSEP